jgi:hypothetical protein
MRLFLGLITRTRLLVSGCEIVPFVKKTMQVTPHQRAIGNLVPLDDRVGLDMGSF